MIRENEMKRCGPNDIQRQQQNIFVGATLNRGRFQVDAEAKCYVYLTIVIAISNRHFECCRFDARRNQISKIIGKGKQQENQKTKKKPRREYKSHQII